MRQYHIDGVKTRRCVRGIGCFVVTITGGVDRLNESCRSGNEVGAEPDTVGSATVNIEV